MQCEQFEERISPFLDGELAASEQAAFREHQMGCLACRELLDDVRQTVTACGQVPDVEPPLELFSRAIVIPALNPPIDCKRFEELIIEFLDGYLEPAVYHAFEDHAEACDGCSDLISGVALSVSACHSVHFSEQLEVSESLVERILAETIGATATAKAAARPAGWRGRLMDVVGMFTGPLWTQRVGTAALIVLAFSVFVSSETGRTAPASLYESAARLTSRVYSQSAEIAGKADRVVNEVERIGEDVNEILNSGSEEKQEEPREQSSLGPSSRVS